MVKEGSPEGTKPARAAAAGLVYAGLVFAGGFLAGAVRVLVLAPALGETAATLVELPVMLALSWVVCGGVVRRLRVAPVFSARAVMGASAFAALMASEVGLAVATGLSFPAFLARLSSPAGALGLFGQLVFATIPLMRRR